VTSRTAGDRPDRFNPPNPSTVPRQCFSANQYAPVSKLRRRRPERECSIMTCPEEITALEAFWRLRRGNRPLPRRSDFGFEDLRPWLGNIGIVSVEGAGPGRRFRVALSGTRLDDYRGRSVTGRYIDDICRNHPDTLPFYERCVLNGEPVHFVHDNSRNSAIYTDMAKLLLPLGEDGLVVDRILLAIYPFAANDAPGKSAYALAG
jgi:hypothetical protein